MTSPTRMLTSEDLLNSAGHEKSVPIQWLGRSALCFLFGWRLVASTGCAALTTSKRHGAAHQGIRWS